jgi:transcriptional regulator with XRE-family HTH domain
MGQQPSPLSPHESPRHFLGAELRGWRVLRQLSTTELAGRVFVSRELVQKVERAERRASQDLIRAVDEVLDTGGALGRLLDFIAHAEQTSVVELEREPVLPTAVTITITAEIVSPSGPGRTPAHRATAGGGARIYTFPAVRNGPAIG